MDLTLTPEMNALVLQAVANGDYLSGDEVVHEALEEWKHRRVEVSKAQNAVRRLWAEGVASGPGQLRGIDEIKLEARRRLAAKAGSSSV